MSAVSRSNSKTAENILKAFHDRICGGWAEMIISIMAGLACRKKRSNRNIQIWTKLFSKPTVKERTKRIGWSFFARNRRRGFFFKNKKNKKEFKEIFVLCKFSSNGAAAALKALWDDVDVDVGDDDDDDDDVVDDVVDDVRASSNFVTRATGGDSINPNQLVNL